MCGKRSESLKKKNTVGQVSLDDPTAFALYRQLYLWPCEASVFLVLNALSTTLQILMWCIFIIGLAMHRHSIVCNCTLMGEFDIKWANEKRCQTRDRSMIIIKFNKPLASASLERRSLHACVRRKLIHIKVAPATADRVDSQSQPQPKCVQRS